MWPAPPRRPGAPRQPRRPAPREPRDQLARLRHLGRRCSWAKSFSRSSSTSLQAAGTGVGSSLGRPPRPAGCRGSRRWAAPRAAIAPSSASGSSRPGGRPSPNTARRRARSARGRRAASTARCAAPAARPRGRPQSTASRPRCAASSSPTPTREPWARIARGQLAERIDDRLGRQARSGASGSDTFEHPALAHAQRRPRGPSAPRRASRRGHASSPSASRAWAHTIVSPTPGSLYRSPCSRSRADRLDHPGARPLGHVGQPGVDDLPLALGARVVDPVVQAAALERVVQLARPVGGQDHDRPALGG